MKNVIYKGSKTRFFFFRPPPSREAGGAWGRACEFRKFSLSDSTEENSRSFNMVTFIILKLHLLF